MIVIGYTVLFAWNPGMHTCVCDVTTPCMTYIHRLVKLNWKYSFQAGQSSSVIKLTKHQKQWQLVFNRLLWRVCASYFSYFTFLFTSCSVVSNHQMSVSLYRVCTTNSILLIHQTKCEPAAFLFQTILFIQTGSLIVNNNHRVYKILRKLLGLKNVEMP